MTGKKKCIKLYILYVINYVLCETYMDINIQTNNTYIYFYTEEERKLTNIDSDDIIKRDKVEARVLMRGFGCALFVSYFSFSGGKVNEKNIIFSIGACLCTMLAVAGGMR